MIRLKNSMLIIITMLFVFGMGMVSVKADCSECSTSNCEECGCVLNDTEDTCIYSNYTKNSTVSCGNITGIPRKIPELTNLVITLIQFSVPIILVIVGSIDLFKGVTAQKEDEIKKGQQMFIKRLVVAAIIFFLIIITKFLISVVADSTDGDNVSKCIDCFLSGVDKCN